MTKLDKIYVVIIGILLILPSAIYYRNFYHSENNEEMAFWENKINLGTYQLTSAMLNRSVDISSITSLFREGRFCSNYHGVIYHTDGLPSSFYSSHIRGWFLSPWDENLWKYELQNHSAPVAQWPKGLTSAIDLNLLLTKFVTDISIIHTLNFVGRDLDESLKDICLESIETTGYAQLSILNVRYWFTVYSVLSFYSVQHSRTNQIVIVIEYPSNIRSIYNQLVYRGNFSGFFMNFVDSINQFINTIS